jgi:hypothetical protein
LTFFRQANFAAIYKRKFLQQRVIFADVTLRFVLFESRRPFEKSNVPAKKAHKLAVGEEIWLT